MKWAEVEAGREIKEEEKSKRKSNHADNEAVIKASKDQSGQRLKRRSRWAEFVS